MTIYPNAPLKDFSKTTTFVLFICRGKEGECNIKTIYRKLHGFTETRTTKDKFGRVFHKKYRYPGIPHHDVISGVFFVEAKDEEKVASFFKKYRVPHIKIRPKEVEVSNWYVHPVGEKSP